MVVLVSVLVVPGCAGAAYLSASDIPPENPMKWSYADMVKTYGEPFADMDTLRIWTTELTCTHNWVFKYPAGGGHPYYVDIGAQYGTVKTARRAYAEACAKVRKTAKGPGKRTRYQGFPAVMYRTAEGRRVTVTWVPSTCMVRVITQ